jgi:hypothetical protein
LTQDEEQRREYERLVATEKYQGVQQMNTTWYEKGQEQGRRAALLEQLEEKFGPLSQEVREKVQQMTWDRLVPLTTAVLRAQSLQELGLDP